MDRIIERAAIGFFTGLGIIVGLSVLWYELKTVVGLAAWLWGLFGALLILLGVAGPLESGAAAYQKGDYAAAIGYWRPLANQGNADAQASLGMMYLKGQGVAQDDAQAVAWLHKAADNGHAGAQNNLGLMYEDGQGVPRDDAQAAIWLRKSADHGYADARVNLGSMYEKGVGVSQDSMQAHMWFSLAYYNATDAAIRDVASELRDEVAAKMTPDQIAEAQRLAREWKPTMQPMQ